VALPADRRADFILIPGEEVSGPKHVHSTAMNTRALVGWEYDDEDKSKIIQYQVDGARAAGGETILNHPNWQWALTTHDIRPVEHMHLFELYNGHPGVRNWGDEAHPSTEAMWDDLLTSGMRMYGVGSDDAHTFQTISPTLTNPGRGWVMVRADTLTGDAITAAMQAGDFYASSGVLLRGIRRGAGRYAIAVDRQTTEAEVRKGEVAGRPVPAGDGQPDGFRVQFIGDGGRILREAVPDAAGEVPGFEVPDDVSYVRARVSYTETRDGERLRYFAWGQPLFTDDR
jgi:hypothetical protein